MKKEVRSLPSQDYLRELFWYEEDTGKLIWLCRPSLANWWNGRYPGTEAGSRKATGHYITIDGLRFKTARVIWKWVTGDDPLGEIDHADIDHYNNCWSNLRDSTRQQNGCNRLPYAKSGMPKGVSFNCNKKRYCAKIVVRYKIIRLGVFDTLDQAVAAYNAAALDHHREFARLNLVAGTEK